MAEEKKKRRKGLGITSKFILWFLFISLIPLAIATEISYNSFKRVLRVEITNNLVIVADNKANQIEAYLSEKINNATKLSQMPYVVDAIKEFSGAVDANGIDSDEYDTVYREFRPFLTYYPRSFGYDGLFLIRNNGDIIYSDEKQKHLQSVYKTSIFGDSELANVFTKVSESSEAQVSGFEYYPQSDKPTVFIAAPVFTGGKMIGAVALRMGNEGVSKLVQDYKGLGETGETIVVSEIAGETVFVTPVRFDPEAAFKRKAPASQDGEKTNMQKALEGESGSGIHIDYRNNKVLSAWKHLPSFEWGMLVKMDTDEIFSSAITLRNNLLIISLLFLVLVVITAIIIARSISSPIRELTNISGVIAKGDFSARVKVKSDDEIGELADTFNKMADNLVIAKNKLEEQKLLLQKANKELDSFVYTASHDLRAPLRGISSFASFLEEDYKDKLDEEGREYLMEIRDGASRMSQLIEDLLQLSRISRIKNPYEDVDISQMVDSVIKRLNFDIVEKNVDLKIQDNLPVIYCDRIKLSEVFLNLINNAIKFSSKDNKERPRVEVGFSEEEDCHKFYVKDNGIGIDPKNHKDVFGIFKRLHNTKEYEGTGAGLSIVKRVIEDHKGKIWVESELGKGAAFCFSIPKNLRDKTGTPQTDMAQEQKEG